MARTFEFVSQFVGCVTVTVSPNQIIIIIIIMLLGSGLPIFACMENERKANDVMMMMKVINQCSILSIV